MLHDNGAQHFDALREEASNVRARLTTAAVEYSDGAITAAPLRAITSGLTERLTEIESRMVRTDHAPVLADLVNAPDVAGKWHSLGIERQRAVLSVLVTITIDKGKLGGAPWKDGKPQPRPIDSRTLRVDWNL